MTLAICDPVPFIQVVDECQSDCTEQLPLQGGSCLFLEMFTVLFCA